VKKHGNFLRIGICILLTAVLVAVSAVSPELASAGNDGIDVVGFTVSETFEDHIAAALAGKCPDGSVVTAETEYGTFSAKASGTTFILRIELPQNTEVSMTLRAEDSTGRVICSTRYTGKPREWVPNDSWATVTGLDSQLFLRKEMSDVTRSNLLDEEELDKLESRIEERINSIKEVLPDTEFIYLIVPSCADIYPERVPDDYPQGTGETLYDQIEQMLTEAGAVVIDARDAMKEHKNDDIPLYCVTDSHWTQYGAFIAYTELFNYISERFPEAAPRSYEDFNWTEGYFEGGDLAYYLNMRQDLLTEEYWTRTFACSVPEEISDIEVFTDDSSRSYSSFGVLGKQVIDTGRSELPSALVYRDSYSVAIYDILAERFDRTYMRGAFDYGWKPEEILEEKPDYVIFIYSEYNMDAITDN
jgi:hypothetical protein